MIKSEETIPDEDDWIYIFPAGHKDKEHYRLRNKVTLSPIGVRRVEDNETFHIGDCVLVKSKKGTPFVGMIDSFAFSSEGFMTVELIWFCRPIDIQEEKKRRDDAEPSEIYITWDINKNPLNVIMNKTTILSRDKFNEKYPDGVNDKVKDLVFFCRRTCNTTMVLYSDELDWDKIYHGRETNLDQFKEYINEITPIDDDPKRRLKLKPKSNTSTPTRNPKSTPQKRSRNYNILLSDVKSASKRLKFRDVSEDEFVDAREEISEWDQSNESDQDKETDSDQPRHRSNVSRPQKQRTPRRRAKDDVLLLEGFEDRKRRPRNLLSSSSLVSVSLPFRPDDSTTGNRSSTSLYNAVRKKFHASAVPDSLPCRENEFSQIFLALESAINAATGSCIYVSGTPGTGKTATVREVIQQLKLLAQNEELPEFSFIEINGLKLINPHTAYEILYEEVSGQRVSSTNAMVLLEKELKVPNPNRVPIVVLMDELDQLVTKNQGVMYNFFNWPTFAHSRLIVIAVANTMDLPERMLSNKISSRLGLTRIQFPGYTYIQLKEIIGSRLKDIPAGVIDKDAIEFTARKIAGVSGDARRALDICRRSVELALASDRDDGLKNIVTIAHVKQAIAESISSTTVKYLQCMSTAGKVFLCAALARIRRTGIVDTLVGDILEESERLVKLSSNAEILTKLLFGRNQQRMEGFLNVISELVESGLMVKQNLKGDRTSVIRLNIGEEDIKSALNSDDDIRGML